MTTLRQAAQAVIKRWDAPLWRDLPATGNCIAALRKALEAEQEPDIKSLQAEGKGPAPCARFCEAQAFTIEIRNIARERDAYQAADLMMTGERDAAVKGRDKLMAAGKIALEACVGFSRAPMTQVEYLSLLRVITALKSAGVSE